MKQKIKKFFTLNRRANGGFTLVELVVVIAILAILAGAAVPAYSGYINKANEAADQQLLAALNTAYASACMENGEFDMTNLSFNPIATIENGAVEMNKFDREFQNYFGNGKFEYFEMLGFDGNEGVFKGNTVAAIKEAVKKALEASDLGDEDVLVDLMKTFDVVGILFGGTEQMKGFSLDTFLAEAPKAVRDKFNFGTFDMTDAEILKKYDPAYADMGLDQIQAKIDAEEIDGAYLRTIKGNAYVMRFAEEAKGKNAETVLADVTEMLGAFGNVNEVTYRDYYKKYINPDATGSEELKVVQDAVAEQVPFVPGELLVGVDASDVKNGSGVTTLGSLYALTAGYYTYKGQEIPENLAYFDDTVKDVLADPDFQNVYLKDPQAKQDLDAYLKAMEYISTGDFNMASGDLFAGTGLEYIMGALGSGN